MSRNDALSIDKNQLSEKDREYESLIRPKNFEEFFGQTQIIENLRVFVKAAKARNEALDHVLLHGPPGLGKTTLSYIIANELGVDIKVTSGPVLENLAIWLDY